MGKLSVPILTLFLALLSCNNEKHEWIRINQLGYRTRDIKVAVFISTKRIDLKSFRIVDVSTGKIVLNETNIVRTEPLMPFLSCYRLPFTKIDENGIYRIEAGDAVSPDFRISDDVYDGTADFLLNYMRQQRCGFNPYLKDSCHTHDGYDNLWRQMMILPISMLPEAGTMRLITSNMLQHLPMQHTRCCLHLSENPASFGDNFLANGLPGTDGIPDVLNESRWGLEWLLKMNPESGDHV